VITWEQVKDLGTIGLARSVRFLLGWYWTPQQKAVLDKAEEVGREAYVSHARSRRE
jgi:hypothetical protein